MAVGADRRHPDRSGLADRGCRDRGDHMALLIVDSDAGAALLDEDLLPSPLIAGERPGDQLGGLLIMGIGRVVVVDEDKRLWPFEP